MYPRLILASPDDTDLLLQVGNLSFGYPWNAERVEGLLREECCRTWMAMSGGAITGFVIVRLEENSTVPRLHFLYIAIPPGSGRRRAAQALMAAAEEWGERLGAANSVLEVKVGSAAVVDLYRGMGYAPTAHLEGYYPGGADGLRMKKTLRPRSGTAAMAARIREVCERIPPVGVVLGSGLGWLAEGFGEAGAIDYVDLTGDDTPGIPGHRGRLVFSSCGRFVFLQGRRHCYQGYDGDEVVMIPGVLGDLGVTRWILTTSSGGLADGLGPGDVMLLADHVNLSGCVPSCGPWRVGSGVYSRELRSAAERAAEETGAGLTEGVFACVTGPAYETPAEAGFLRRRGISTVSMSTAQEALYLSALGYRVAALSMVTNHVAGGGPVSHEEVLSAQAILREKRGRFMRRFLERAARV